ncbi:MAG: efflux RND transporter permease subunit [Proteobacteria bacterium]|nr:efflux RND transporter permease subunit [Pseudomonadota bacterium]MCL2307400.1 efflux RND transporter permease subunit [Pseudomonadota bacterium]
MNVSAWSIRNPIPPIMLFILLCVGGIYGFQRMQVQNFPDLDMPMVTVVAALPGATPGQLENDVARRIEDSVATIQGLRHTYSSIQDGMVTVMLEFKLEKPLQEAVDDVRSAVARVRSDLPSDLLDPVINRVDFASLPILAYAVRSSRWDDEALSWFIDNELSKRLLAVKGVGAVTRVGGVSREIRVTLDPLRLQALGVTATEISRQIRQMQIEMAGGRAEVSGGEQPIRTLANVASAEELARMEIPLWDGRRIRLSDVATVQDSVAETRSLALLDGMPAVGFEVTRARGEGEVETGAGIRVELQKMLAAHPDLEIVEAFNFADIAQEEYKVSMRMLYEGAFLAVFVVFLFLRDFRATIVAAVALPLSAISAFLGMYLFGYTINIITLIALSLVVGVLVDDAIVEVENIVRHLRMGKTPRQAALDATAEIGLPVVATTATLVAVFLPIAFMDGIAGLFFKQFGWTAVIAVSMSLVVARMITPILAATMFQPFMRDHSEPRWVQWYTKRAEWCLQHRALTLFGALAFFIASMVLAVLLPKDFMAADDNSQTQIYLELPPGSTLEQTHHLVKDVHDRLATLDHIERIYTTIGGGSAGGDAFAASSGNVRKASLTLQLSARGERPRKQVIEHKIRAALETLPGARFDVGWGDGSDRYKFTLMGDDPEALRTAALAIERDLRTLPGLGNVKSSASLIRPEIAVRPDFARASDLGVTSFAIADTLRIATLGDYDVALAKLNLSQRQVPILVKLDDKARSDLAMIGRLTLPGTHGPVMLSEIASLEMFAGPAQITRYNRSRDIRFEVELGGTPMGDVSEKIRLLPSVRDLPPGLNLMDIAEAEFMNELFLSFLIAILAGILCVYAVLVLLFRNFLHPIALLAALPLSLGGAFVGLLLTGSSFSMSSLLGLVLLMGLATKNSILLVEYAITAQRNRGLERLEALLDACRKRARPIVMTSIAMSAGMTPLALGLGNVDATFRAPMAISVIGGLFTSTVLSLLIVPVVFTYVDDFARWLRRIRA